MNYRSFASLFRSAASFVPLILFALVASCGAEEGEGGPGAIQLVSDGGLADTVLSRGLIKVVGVGGSLQATNVTLKIEIGAGESYNAFVCAVASECFPERLFSSGDDTVRAEIQRGTRTDTIPLRVMVPKYGIDTVLQLVILPGAPATARFTVGDTVLNIGGTGQFTVHSYDAQDNRRAGAGTMTAVDGLPFVPATGVATAATIGRYRLAGAAEGFVDTIEVSVVPPYTVVALSPGAMGVLRRSLDGSGNQILSGGPGPDVGSGHGGLGFGLPGRTTVTYIRSAQARTRSVDGGAETTIDTWDLVGIPGKSHPALDSAWIFSETYFSQFPYVAIARFRPDGTGEEILATPEWTPAPANRVPAALPSPSPDGTKVAYVRGNGAAFIRVYTIGVGASAWMVSGQVPRWSPLGDQVAYTDEYGPRLRLLDPVTGNSTQLGPDSVAFAPVRPSWTLDGAYILAVRATGGWVMVRVSDGFVLPLPTLKNLTEVLVVQ